MEEHKQEDKMVLLCKVYDNIKSWEVQNHLLSYDIEVKIMDSNATHTENVRDIRIFCWKSDLEKAVTILKKDNVL